MKDSCSFDELIEGYFLVKLFELQLNGVTEKY